MFKRLHRKLTVIKHKNDSAPSLASDECDVITDEVKLLLYNDSLYFFNTVMQGNLLDCYFIILFKIKTFH